MVLLSMVPSADSDGIMPNSALEKKSLNLFLCPIGGFMEKHIRKDHLLIWCIDTT